MNVVLLTLNLLLKVSRCVCFAVGRGAEGVVADNH